MTFSESGPVPAQGDIAQQMFWYTAFTADMVKPGLPVMNEDGTPKWRMAPSPHGVYWKDGMKLGYQDVGSWTLMKSTPDDRAKAAWLYAQFVTSKTVDVKKSHVGLTFIRECTIQRQELHRARAEARRPDRVLPLAGPRPVVADRHQRARLSEAGAALVAGIGDALSGAKTPQEAMDSLCAEQEKVLERLERAGVQGDIGPKLNEEQDAQVLARRARLARRPKLANENPKAETVAYDELIKSWQTN